MSYYIEYSNVNKIHKQLQLIVLESPSYKFDVIVFIDKE